MPKLNLIYHPALPQQPAWIVNSVKEAINGALNPVIARVGEWEISTLHEELTFYLHRESRTQIQLEKRNNKVNIRFLVNDLDVQSCQALTEVLGIMARTFPKSVCISHAQLLPIDQVTEPAYYFVGLHGESKLLFANTDYQCYTLVRPPEGFEGGEANLFYDLLNDENPLKKLNHFLDDNVRVLDKIEVYSRDHSCADYQCKEIYTDNVSSCYRKLKNLCRSLQPIIKYPGEVLQDLLYRIDIARKNTLDTWTKLGDDLCTNFGTVDKISLLSDRLGITEEETEFIENLGLWLYDRGEKRAAIHWMSLFKCTTDLGLYLMSKDQELLDEEVQYVQALFPNALELMRINPHAAMRMAQTLNGLRILENTPVSRPALHCFRTERGTRSFAWPPQPTEHTHDIRTGLDSQESTLIQVPVKKCTIL